LHQHAGRAISGAHGCCGRGAAVSQGFGYEKMGASSWSTYRDVPGKGSSLFAPSEKTGGQISGTGAARSAGERKSIHEEAMPEEPISVEDRYSPASHMSPVGRASHRILRYGCRKRKWDEDSPPRQSEAYEDNSLDDASMGPSKVEAGLARAHAV
jgi:hypothetical protein